MCVYHFYSNQSLEMFTNVRYFLQIGHFHVPVSNVVLLKCVLTQDRRKMYLQIIVTSR